MQFIYILLVSLEKVYILAIFAILKLKFLNQFADLFIFLFFTISIAK